MQYVYSEICFNEIFINLNLRFKRDLNVIELFFAEETKDVFLPLRFYQFQRSVSLSPQNAKGRHFITAYDNKSSTYQVSHQYCIRSDINHVSGQIYQSFIRSAIINLSGQCPIVLIITQILVMY